MSMGYVGRILLVDLTSGSIEEHTLPEATYRGFLGASGLGVRMLYEYMKPGTDPMGPDNIIGFAPGILTGIGAPMSSRYEVFAKSPLTNAWGQGNSGGHFANELKRAGYDALFFRGISPKPVYLFINDGKAELRDAGHIWGKDTVETEEMLREELRDGQVRVACIGPSGESCSLISCVINDRGRAAARAGTGAVMGAKRLKAVAVRGSSKIQVADPDRMRMLRSNFLKDVREPRDTHAKVLKDYGTCGTFVEFTARGDAPIKNWSLQGLEAFPNAEKIHKGNVTRYQVKRYFCYDCTLGCGGIVKVGAGPYALRETHKPEYETLASFGSLCLNDDVESIIWANDICNRYGLDTLSAGTAIAFAIECYENNIISKRETDGIELTWGNASSIVSMLEKLARREGFGDVLADGVKKAAERIGRGAEQYAMHIAGQEPGCRDTRFVPSRGVGYIADAAPGRHTASTMQVIFEQGAPMANYPELRAAQRELKGGPLYAVANKYQAALASAGLCSFTAVLGTYPLVEFIAAATGWDFTFEEALRVGHRIQTLRQAFIMRDGIVPGDFRLPERMSRTPAQGPLEGRTHDFDALKSSFYEAMGWESRGDAAGRPLKSTLQELGLHDIVL
jgi:aldehyde:ferredoxin oxidoreductase